MATQRIKKAPKVRWFCVTIMLYNQMKVEQVVSALNGNTAVAKVAKKLGEGKIGGIIDVKVKPVARPKVEEDDWE